MDNQELISALADGQLRGEEFARGVQAATADARGRQTWWTYHVVGEALRSGRVDPGMPAEAFLARLEQRLQQEAPRPALAATGLPAVQQPSAPPANDWLWKLAAGVASVAAVTAVGWNLWGAASTQPQLASAPVPAAAATIPVARATPAEARPAAVMRDPRLDQLLAAHRQLAGGTALQSSSGFLRNATFDTSGR